LLRVTGLGLKRRRFVRFSSKALKGVSKDEAENEEVFGRGCCFEVEIKFVARTVG
jgi:hypothetical protein